MYNKHKILIIILFASVFTACFVLEISSTANAMNAILAFLSIVFGFVSISMSILFSSKNISILYKAIDPINKNQRKIHTIKKYYAYSMYFILFGIIATLISIIMIDNQNIFSNRFIFPYIIRGVSYMAISSSFCTIFLAFLNTRLTLINLVNEAKVKS